MPYERTTDSTNAGDFLAEDVNNDFDRLWIATQQVNEEVNRSLKAPVTDPLTIDMTLPAKASRVGKLLRFNATTGDPEAVATSDVVGSGAFNVYNFTGDGSDTTFVLGTAPGVENNTQVYIDGVYQQKNTYTLSGSTITFSAAPPNLSTIEVMVMVPVPLNTVSASGVSFVQSGSTDTRTVQAKLEESVSVKDFGAVGDGVTDDAPAFRLAIAASKNIFVPAGNYLIGSNIDINTSATFVGEGVQATYIERGYSPAQDYEGIIDGNSANNTLFNVCDSITCSGEGSIVRNCRILDAADIGIMFPAATHGQCINNYIKGATDAGIYVNNSSETNDYLEGAIISGNVCQDCDYGGINIKRSSGYIIVSNNTIHNCGNGLTVEEFGTGSGGEPDHLLIANNLVKDIGYNFRSLSPAPSESGLNVQLSKYCVITGNKFVNVSGLVFGLDGAQFCTVTGNNFRGYTTSPSTTGFGNVGAMFTTRSSVDPDYNVFSANIVSGCQDEGIYMVSGEYNVVTSNVVREIDGAGASNQAFRIDANGDNNIVSDNIFHAPTVDTGINSGALGNIFDTNKTPNATGTAINGIRRDTANTTPVGNVVPFYAGEFYYITTGSKLFFATGTTNTDWIALN
jgi:parallel beta-helix repeat protein